MRRRGRYLGVPDPVDGDVPGAGGDVLVDGDDVPDEGVPVDEDADCRALSNSIRAASTQARVDSLAALMRADKFHPLLRDEGATAAR